MELDALSAKADAFAEHGASLVFVCPQEAGYNREMAEGRSKNFILLEDPGNRVAAQYGLVHRVAEELVPIYRSFKIDLDRYNGDDSWTLPLPARLIIDPKGIIRYAAINADYTERPEPEETLEALKALASP